MTSTVSATARDAILSQRDIITKITGEITPEDIDNLEEEIGGTFTIVKTHHFEEGETYGSLAVIAPESEYQTLIGNAAWTYVPPASQAAYNPAAVGATVAQRAVLEHDWKRLQDSRDSYLGVCEGGKELIVYAVGEDALAGLKKRYVNFGSTTPRAMIEHLRTKTCIKMTTLEKDIFKTEGYKRPWDTTQSIVVYFKSLDDLSAKLANRDIPTSDEEKANAAVARMWESGFFTETKLTDWERKPKAKRGWPEVKTYFEQLYHDHKQYSRATAKKARFADTAFNIKEAVENESGGIEAPADDATMVLQMMQAQHAEQLSAMKESNERALEMATQAMKTMATQMTQFCAANAIRENGDKENANPNSGGGGNRRGGGGGGDFANQHPRADKPWKAKRKLCPNCKHIVYHKPEKCLELEANKSKRMEGWKSRLS